VTDPDDDIDTGSGGVPAQCSAFAVERHVELPDPATNPEVVGKLSSMQLDQKIRLMYGWEGCSYNEGFQCFTNQGVPEASVPDWRLHDGPRGVRTLASITASTTFPVSVARAASFDVDLEDRTWEQALEHPFSRVEESDPFNEVLEPAWESVGIAVDFEGTYVLISVEFAP
jgi:hypothetical protein